MINPKKQTEDLLETLKSIEGLQVYFQVPSNIKMKYPCIIVNMRSVDNKYADNSWYRPIYTYNLTLIELTKHSEFMPILIKKLIPYIRHDSNVETNGLFHNYFTVRK